VTETQTPDQVLVVAQDQMILKFEVIGIAHFPDLRARPRVAVELALQGRGRPL
jgi:hypothetical protein